MKTNMKSFIKILAVATLVLCLSLAVGCDKKGHVVENSGSEPEYGMPTQTYDETIPDSGDNVVDFENPDGTATDSSGSTSSANTSGATSTVSSGTTSSKTSSVASTTSTGSENSTSSTQVSSQSGGTSSKSELANETDTNAGKYDTPGWLR